MPRVGLARADIVSGDGPPGRPWADRRKSTMRRSTVGIILVLTLGCVVALRAAEAQGPGKVYRIGVLGLGYAAADINVVRLENLRLGLRELGYVEGRNLTLEYRWAEGRPERLADLADELVRLPVDLMVTWGTVGVQVAKHTTTTLPIVAAIMGDPVENGIVESLARPGGNITGLSFSERELAAKRLELLKETVPGVTRVAVLLWAVSPPNQAAFKAMEPTARELGVALLPVEVHGPDDFERAFTAIAHGHAEALVVADNQLFTGHRERIRDFIIEKRLPAIGSWREYFMTYTISTTPTRRAAVFIDKILQGARPGDLPMERVAQFELTIDLKIAQELGLTVPESLLMRADKVFPVSGVPLPVNIRIVPPDRRVASELAAFSGKWFGTWEGDMTGEHFLVVEAIDPPHALVIFAQGNDTVGAGTTHQQRILSNWFRLRGQFVEGALQVIGPGGAIWSYRRQPDGTLAVTQTWLGAVSRATMTRAPE
jgi:putative ABC transport system substrate-binding protein